MNSASPMRPSGCHLISTSSAPARFMSASAVSNSAETSARLPTPERSTPMRTPLSDAVSRPAVKSPRCASASFVAGSSGSLPEMAESSIAASFTLRAIGPAVSCDTLIGMMCVRLTRPTVGFSPTAPLTLAGQVIEPSVSVPIAAGASPKVRVSAPARAPAPMRSEHASPTAMRRSSTSS